MDEESAFINRNYKWIPPSKIENSWFDHTNQEDVFLSNSTVQQELSTTFWQWSNENWSWSNNQYQWPDDIWWWWIDGFIW